MAQPQTFLDGITEVQNEIANPNNLPVDPQAGTILMTIILWILGLLAVIALGVVIISAFTYILSLGDEGRVEKAKRMLIYAVVGLILAAGAFFIIDTVRDLLTT